MQTGPQFAILDCEACDNTVKKCPERSFRGPCAPSPHINLQMRSGNESDVLFAALANHAVNSSIVAHDASSEVRRTTHGDPHVF